MLNIRFQRNSAPATDEELLYVIDGIRPALESAGHPDRDYALLLAKLLLRIEEFRELIQFQFRFSAGDEQNQILATQEARDHDLNRVGARQGAIIAHVARLAMQIKKDKREFDPLTLGQVLRDELPLIAGRVADETFSVVACIAASLLNEGAQSMIADFRAATVVAAAKGKGTI